MNKEYIYLNGQAVVIDEDNKKELREYSSNFDEILEQENLIEMIEKELEKKRKKLKKLQYEVKDFKSSRNFFLTLPLKLLIAIPIMEGIIICLTSSFSITQAYDYLLMQIQNIFANPALLKTLFVSVGVYTGLLIGPSGLLMHGFYKKSQVESISVASQVSLLEKRYDIELKKLCDIKILSKEVVFDDDYFVKKVDDDKIVRLQKRLELYNYLITSKKLLTKYLETGKIPKELAEMGLEEEDIEVIKKVDKGKILSLNKK